MEKEKYTAPIVEIKALIELSVDEIRMLEKAYMIAKECTEGEIQ